MNNEIQSIISGKVAVKHGTTICTVACNLGRSEKTGSLAKTDKRFKIEETARLKQIVETQNLWVHDIDLNNYVSEGAEQKVYLKNNNSVVKLNDAIYYVSWIDYLNNLLLNNYFFPDTAYNLLGFFEHEQVLYAVVEQLFIKATEVTDLNNVRQFMQANGFDLIRNNDYINHELGIIIEDLHDENVLTNNGVLYFIDTVFYIQ
jgi:putative ubiquitin-RnfH superfamily antitoxin RatB of RatAB toxin-antitoxin module